MKFGILGSNAGPFAYPEHARALAAAAEEAGFESLWTVEHVVVPAGYGSRYPYSRSGKMPGGEEAPIPDPLMWMAFVAAVTRRITLATGVLILPEHNPVLLAKECATLDLLSGGRLLLGVGVGWLKEEFEALGVPFEKRGARADEYIQAMRALWTEAEPTYRGRFVSFERAKCHPKPTRGTVPIVVGGHSEGAARRAGRLGDGFFPYVPEAEEVARLIGTMRYAASDAGRDPDAIEITVRPAADLEDVKRYADMGVSRVCIAPPAYDAEGLRRGLGEFAERVIARV